MKAIFKKYLKTVALIWSGCLVMFFIVYIYLLAPQRKTKKQIEKQLADKKQTYDSALKVTQEETKKQLEEQLGNLRNTLRNFVIDFEDSTHLTLDISQIAGEKKVASFTIKGKDDRRGRSSEIPGCENICENHIKISFNADFNQFATFLNALERHRPVLFVDRFTITRSDDDPSSHPVNMDLAVFVRKPQTSETLSTI